MSPVEETHMVWLLVSLYYSIVEWVYVFIFSNFTPIQYTRHNTGIIGLVVSFLISLFSSLGRDSALITTVAGFIMAVLYTLCAGLLTFDNGPATYVGNHYFSAWAGFFISFAVFGSVLKEFLGVGNAAAATPAAENAGGDDTEMDNI